MVFLTIYVVITITIIVNCTSKPNTPTKKAQSSKKLVSLRKPKKNNSKKNQKPQLIQEKSASAKTPTEESKGTDASKVLLKNEETDPIASNPSPKSDEHPRKKEPFTPKKPETTAGSKRPSPVSVALKTVDKKPSNKESKKASIYVPKEDEKNEMKKTAKTQSATSLPASTAEPTKPMKTTNESSAQRHRKNLKPGEVNDKSDDTIEDAPSVRKIEGPSYESDGTPVVSPNEKPIGIEFKKLSKEKGDEKEAAK